MISSKRAVCCSGLVLTRCHQHYTNKSVAIIARYGLSMNQQEGKESSTVQIGVFHPYYTNSWSASEVYHRYHLFYIWLLQSWLSIQVMYIFFGHYDPSSGKPLGYLQVLVYRNTNHHGLCINRSQKVEQVFTISKHHSTCSMAWQIKEFLLSYYKKLQNGSNWEIVFKHWHTIDGKLAAGLRCFIWTVWRLRIICAITSSSSLPKC